MQACPQEPSFGHRGQPMLQVTPVIAAGGIGDARGVVAALALGAEGVQLGTAFLVCEESGASPVHREALLGKHAGHTALTRGFTGRLARGIHNRLMEELNRNGTEILPYPLQRAVVRNLSIPRGGRGPTRTFASVGRAKRQSFDLYRRVGLLRFVGRRRFQDFLRRGCRGKRHPGRPCSTRRA